MTVCIAARTEGMILLISDRMITAGDIEFEPPSFKIQQLTTSISMMYSGDSALFSEIVQNLIADVRDRVAAEPDNWLRVGDVARLYLKHWNEVRMRRAELEIFFPLGMTRKEFAESTTKISPEVLDRIMNKLSGFSMSGLEVIIAGVDQRLGCPLPSIYHIADDALMCMDQTAFVAIGSGARHAESQLMVAKYFWGVPNGDALLLTYSAKRSSEVAPGVGRETDIVVIGPNVGQTNILPDRLKKKIEIEYQRILKKDEVSRRKARDAITAYLEDPKNKPVQAPQTASIAGTAISSEGSTN